MKFVVQPDVLFSDSDVLESEPPVKAKGGLVVSENLDYDFPVTIASRKAERFFGEQSANATAAIFRTQPSTHCRNVPDRASEVGKQINRLDTPDLTVDLSDMKIALLSPAVMRWNAFSSFC